MPVLMVKGNDIIYKCPGCGWHSLPVKIGVKTERFWEWNGDVDKPTISPSVKHFYPGSVYKAHPNMPAFCCHYHIKNGNIEFCNDCTHEHNSKTLPMQQFTEAEIKLHEG